MMMKKKLAALLLAAASAMVFTGCGSSDNQSKGSVDKKGADRILACSLRKLRRCNC